MHQQRQPYIDRNVQHEPLTSSFCEGMTQTTHSRFDTGLQTQLFDSLHVALPRSLSALQGCSEQMSNQRSELLKPQSYETDEYLGLSSNARFLTKLALENCREGEVLCLRVHQRGEREKTFEMHAWKSFPIEVPGSIEAGRVASRILHLRVFEDVAGQAIVRGRT